MYLSVYILSLLTAFFCNKNNKFFITIILIIILALFAGTRYYIDNDYWLYTELFTYNTERLSEYVPFGESELSFYIFPYILSKIFLFDYIKYCFLIFAFIGVGVKLFAIKDYQYYVLAVCLYVSNLYFIQEMTTIRAGVASGIFLLSLKDIAEKNDRKFFIKIIFAILFHHSSVIFILIWAVSKFAIKMKTLVVLLFCSLLVPIFKLNFISLLFLDKIFPKAAVYIAVKEFEETDLNLFNFKILISLIILFFFLYNYYKGKIKEKEVVLYIKIHLLSIMLFFIFSSTGLTFSLRLFEMLSIVQIVLFPLLVNLFLPKFRLIAYSLVFSISLVYFYYNIFVIDSYKEYMSWMF